MDNFIAARSQMGMSLAFHIIYATIGVSLPLMMTIAEWRWRSTGDPAYLILAKRWAKGTTILFTVGAVSGAVLSFELGLQQKITGDRDELARQSASLSGTPVHPLRLVLHLAPDREKFGLVDDLVLDLDPTLANGPRELDDLLGFPLGGREPALGLRAV